MLFNSPSFIFVFLPVTVILYRLIPGMRWKNTFLAAAGLVFYTFGQLRCLPLLLGSVLWNYVAGRLLVRYSLKAQQESREKTPEELRGQIQEKTPEGLQEQLQGQLQAQLQASPRHTAQPASRKKARTRSPEERLRRAVLIASVAGNLLLLICCKYADFLVSGVNTVTGLSLALPGFTLPLGVSFFTFQGISYVVDVYRDPDSGTADFMEVLLFIAFFPRLISGPLVRYADVRESLQQRVTSPTRDVYGISRFITGLAKKVLISAAAAAVADKVFEMTAGSVASTESAVSAASAASVSSELVDSRLAWLGAFCYMIQIYYDFSGYSDMAIGLSALFGFQTAENFDHPYAALSVRDFWRRWHISLSSWFRDYLYIPLGGSRRGRWRTFLNRMTVFLCTGIWHGANMTFIVWGVCHGLLSNLEDLGLIPVVRLKKSVPGRLLCRVYMLLSVMLLFVVFRADSLTQAWLYLRSMFCFTAADGAVLQLTRLLTPMTVFMLLSGVLFAGTPGKKLGAYFISHSGTVRCFIPLFLLFLLCLMSISRGGFAPFIYFQF